MQQNLSSAEFDLFNHGPVMILTWKNEDGWPIESAAGNVQALLGYGKSELASGQVRYADLLHPDDRSRVVSAIADQSTNDADYLQQQPYRLLTRNGDCLWVLDTTRILRSESGQITQYHGCLIDISAQKENEERLSLSIQGSDLGTWDWNVQTGEVIFNTHWATMLGYDPEEIEPNVNSWSRLMHPDEVPTVKRILSDHLEGRTASYQAEHRLRSKSGEWIWIQDSGKVISRDAQGKALRMAGTHKNITARKTAEEKYATLFNEASIGIAVADVQNGVILECNQAMADLLERSRSELVGAHQSVMHPAGRIGELTESFLDHLNNKPGQVIETECITASGKVLNVEIKATRLKIGRHDALVGFFIDVTERRQAEEKLEKGERFLQNVLNSVKDGINVLDKDLNIVLVNDQIRKQYAHNLPLIGKKCYQAFMDRDSLCPWCPSIKALESGKNQSVEIEVPHPDGIPGKKGWIELYAYPLLEKGDITGVIEYGRDITDRKLAAMELKKNHDLLADVLNSIDAGVYVSDLDTDEILFVNQHINQTFGRDLTGEICWKAMRGRSERCSDCLNDQLLDVQGHPRGTLTQYLRHEGLGREFLLRNTAIHWHDGRLVHLQIGTDVTEMKQMEQQLNRRSKMEALGVLAGGVAHNFNNNLAIILGNLELAEIRREDRAAHAAFIAGAKKTIINSRDLVRQLLSYTSPRSLPLAETKEKLLLTEIMDETCGLLRSTLPKNIKLVEEKEISQSESVIEGYSAQIMEAVINLSNNAVYAMDESGLLTIRLDKTELNRDDIPEGSSALPGVFVRLRISDTGCGMDPDVQEKFFDPFFTTKPVNEGTGLGLSTVQGVMNHHRGMIRVQSRPHQGASFELYFPADLTTAIKADSLAGEAGISDESSNRKRILIVDDELDLLRVSRQIFELNGFEVHSLADPNKAVELISTGTVDFDLIVTDQVMPEMTGTQMIAMIRQLQPDMPIILLTGYISKAKDEETAGLRISKVCQKPVVFSELVDLAKQLVTD